MALSKKEFFKSAPDLAEDVHMPPSSWAGFLRCAWEIQNTQISGLTIFFPPNFKSQKKDV